MKKILALLLLIFSLSSFGFYDPQTAYNKYLTGEAVIIDVREAHELVDGIVKGAIWFPKSKIDQDENWKKDFLEMTEGKEIFLYCRSGNRSGKVKELLETHSIPSENLGGFKDLKDILPVSIP